MGSFPRVQAACQVHVLAGQQQHDGQAVCASSAPPPAALARLHGRTRRQLLAAGHVMSPLLANREGGRVYNCCFVFLVCVFVFFFFFFFFFFAFSTLLPFAQFVYLLVLFGLGSSSFLFLFLLPCSDITPLFKKSKTRKKREERKKKEKEKMQVELIN